MIKSAMYFVRENGSWTGGMVLECLLRGKMIGSNLFCLDDLVSVYICKGQKIK